MRRREGREEEIYPRKPHAKALRHRGAKEERNLPRSFTEFCTRQENAPELVRAFLKKNLNGVGQVNLSFFELINNFV